MKIDRRAVERQAPLDHTRVVVRMGNGDGSNASKLAEGGDGGLIEQRQTIPQHISLRRLEQESALADREMRLGVYGIETRFLELDNIAMLPRQLFERRPLLAVQTYELAGILADETRRRRFVRGRELRAASGTQERSAHHEAA